MIPYVIAEAYPDYKRPSVEHYYGVVKEEEMEKYFLNQISNFVLDRTGDNELSLQDINDFFDNYYEDYFMMNKPWTAMVFRNGNWENVTPNNVKIWEHIKLILLQEQQDIEKDKQEEENEEEDEQNNEDGQEDNELELEEDEWILLDKMKEFFDKMLKEKPLPSSQIESLQKMNEVERLSSLLSIYMTTENYNNNKDMFCSFLNFLIKIMQISIENISKKIETDKSDELCKQLENALTVYNNALFVKQTFNI